MTTRLLPTCALLLFACGDDDGGVSPDAPPGGADATPRADAASACPRALGPADRVRKVVVSHPVAEGPADANAWEVLELDTSGQLTPDVARFEMGRATIGRVTFTPDGEVGLVAQVDGTLGVFRFDEAGAPVVVHERFRGSFYADAVVMDPGGERAYVIDPNWVKNGGGIYSVAIACDGTLREEGLLVPAKLPAALILDGARAFLAAATAFDSPEGYEVHLLDWSAPPILRAGADAFMDDEAILSDGALGAGGRWFALGDNSGFSSVPNRVALIEVEGDTMTARQIVDVEDPISIVGTAGSQVFLVASGFGDGAYVLARGAGSWTATELEYAGPPPQLPGSAVVVERGALAGHVLLAENTAVRQLSLGADAVTDLGPVSLGDGFTAITGAIGVQP